MANTLVPPLKWHGGKAYLAKDIIKLMPPRCQNPNAPDPKDKGWLHFCEPYFGGGQVLFELDPTDISEVVNDLNGDLVNFWKTIAETACFAQFARHVEGVPFSQEHFRQCKDPFWPDSIQRAVAFFIRCRQSLSGRMKGFAGITRNRTRRGMNEQVSAWWNVIEGLPEVHERLKRVLILNDDALNVIRKEDGPRTLFYLDPPYLHSTRATTGEYEHEMSGRAHALLLATLATSEKKPLLSFAELEALDGIESYSEFVKAWTRPLQGRFLLSGYRSALYDRFADALGWTRHEFKVPNNAAGGKKKKRMTECLWLNY